MRIIINIVCGVLMACAFNAGAEQRIEVGESRIYADQDQPSISYIIPWKETGLDKIDVNSINEFMEKALVPVNRYDLLIELGLRDVRKRP